jgi:ATP-dependent RNA helicase DeaD
MQNEPVDDDRRKPKRDARQEPSAARGNAVWFTVNVGRSKNADPKWIIPLLCRRGGITKASIGKIQILARETRVEIAANDADRFGEAALKPDAKDKNIHIERLDADGAI